MPLTRRQVYFRRRLAVFGVLALVLAILVYLPLTLLAPLKAAALTITTPDEPVPAVPALAWPGYGASAIGAVGFPGVLAQSGETTALPIASITKVITALVVLQAHPLAVGEDGPTVTMTSADAALYGSYLAQNGTVAPVRAGLQLTELQLLELMLVKSANNYAMSTAMWAFGSQDAYLDATHTWLTAHGLTGITVLEPTGINPANVGETDDLVELGRIALTDPVIASIVNTTSVDIPQVGVLPNTNELLGQDGVDGIKTGTLDPFGANLLFSADYLIGGTTVTVIGVVLGGPNHDVLDHDILALLATVSSNFTEVEVAAAAEPFATYQADWGASTQAVAAGRTTLVTWAGTAVTADVEVSDLRTGHAGALVGAVTFTSGTQTVTVELDLGTDLDDPGPLWRLTNPAALF
ncbi:MAG: D-alanyl-D-alanine carboxypeptidase [Pseudolysinimonas sp.]|uniref:D-alanyl-D-alanine carboxypeptidase family protein n=1 Tax=Pseudolysinimonas sp. TaxID=2680009 RepID=UPI003264472B